MFDEIQKWKNEYYLFDIDSSPEVYKLYEKIYSDKIKKEYCIETPKFYRYVSSSKGYIDAPDVALANRLFALSSDAIEIGRDQIKNREYIRYNAVERLSGDCFFNFNDKKVEKLKEIKGVDINSLEQCKNMHHSIENMVLIQSLGNMQKRKQIGIIGNTNKREQLDRGDSFLYLLNEYYKYGNEEILDSSSKSNRPYLINYLQRYKSICEYSSEMLQIDDFRLLEEMIDIGGENLSTNNINKYLDIAKKFWELRKKKIDELLK